MPRIFVLFFAITMFATALAVSESVERAYLSTLTLEGAGASFPNPIYSKWGDAFNKETGMKLNYQSIGSGGGIRSIKEKTVSFGASDAPLTVKELDESGLTQFPMIVGGVVPVFNLGGIARGVLKMTPMVLADIYLGKITNWNDPAIAAINNGLTLPDKAITVVHRSDGSGTTWIFTNYLSKVSPQWQDKVGNDKAVEWPVGIGGKGNEGVANSVKQVDGAIGYVEYAYVIHSNLNYALLQNSDGNFVAPTAESFQSATASADWKNSPGYYVVLTDQPGDMSWPITGASFILIYKQHTDWKQTRAMLEFFDWCLRNGGNMASDLDYVPIPLGVVEIIEAKWAQEIRAADRQVWEVISTFEVAPDLKDKLASLTLEGAGASFPNPIYTKWAATFHGKYGMKLNYQSIGSGGGIRQIKAKTVSFGASDAPLTLAELNESGLMQFPMVMGGVVLIVNLPGIGPGKLSLSPNVLADIFLAKITRWNDPAISAINNGLALPDKAITVVHRSDGSGTTWIFTNYLSKVSTEWSDKIGNDKAVEWPIGIGGKGNEGVANSVKQVECSIGYVEYAYALQSKLSHTKLMNKAGNFVQPTDETFQAAAANADWANSEGYNVSLTDQPGDLSWPITGASFMLIYKEQADMVHARCMLTFFDWCLRSGGQLAGELDYIPMPANVVELVEKYWADNVKVNGASCWKK